VTQWLETRPHWIALAVFIPYLAELGVRLAGRPVWFDEIFTWRIALLGWGPAWDAVRSGADNQPPLYYWLVRLAMLVLGENTVALRIWSATGALVMLGLVYWLTGRRYGWLAAASAVAAIRLTHTGVYALEARPYGLLLGAGALAACCWLVLAEPGRRRWKLLALALGIGLAGGCHYFGILVIVPLVVGQAVRDWPRKQVDWPVWVTMAVASLPWLGQFLFQYQSLALYRSGFWSAPRLHMINATLGLYLLAPAMWLLPAFVYWILHQTVRRRREPAVQPAFAIDEAVVVIGLATMPVWFYPIALVSGAYDPRYVAPSAVGWAVLFAWLIARADARAAATALLAFTVLALYGVRLLETAVRWNLRLPVVVSELRALASVRPSGDIVVADGHRYLQAHHYADPQTRARLVYLADVPRALLHSGTDTDQLAITHLARTTGIAVDNYETYVKSHDSIWIWQTRGAGFGAWLGRSLLREGWTMAWFRDFAETELVVARRGSGN
jgi:hypothetical protein